MSKNEKFEQTNEVDKEVEIETTEVKEEVDQNTKTSEYDELNDRYKRILAEFENFKKRSQKERESLYNSILGDIITGILPAIDNLENAVKAESKDEKYKQGIELVQKQFKEMLTKHNVEEIEAEGKVFDPALHEAVSSVQVEGKASQEIVQVYRKGYKIGSKVLRHAMVVVNQ